MPLQIRRGTNAERLAMTVPLAQGELLYVTDDQRLYVGNGTTLGGVQITGYTNEDAQDAAASMFTSGSHSGISFSYNDAANTINATLDLSNYTGTINAASFKGTIVADDSTLLVDAVDGKINLDGTVKGNIVPDANEAYDIGTASYRFRDLYLKGTSIYLGGAQITNPSGSIVDLPTGATVNSVPILASNAGGNVNIGIVANDSSVMVNTSSKTFTGSFDGDLTGSVYSDTSSIIVDGTDGSITASDITLSGTLNVGGADVYYSGGILSIGTPTVPLQVDLQSDDNASFLITSWSAGSGTGGAPITFNTHAGTDLVTKNVIQADQSLGGMVMFGWNGTAYVPAAQMVAFVDPSAGDLTGSSYIQSAVVIAPASTSALSDTTGLAVATVGGVGLAQASIFRATPFTDATERDTTISSPLPGMIVYITSTNKLQAYNGSGWQDLF